MVLTFLDQSLTMDPPVQFPHLTKTHELEAQGLVVFIPSGIHFCKNWSSVTMYSFLERYLPRPFQYFKEQGFSGPTPSRPRNLPFCILERRAGRFSVVKHPENGPTGKFYQDNATGTKGSSFKNRNLVLSQSNTSSFSISLISHTFQFQRSRSPGIYLMSGNATHSLLGWAPTIWKLTMKSVNKCMVPAGCDRSREKVWTQYDLPYNF